MKYHFTFPLFNSDYIFVSNLLIKQSIPGMCGCVCRCGREENKGRLKGNLHGEKRIEAFFFKNN